MKKMEINIVTYVVSILVCLCGAIAITWIILDKCFDTTKREMQSAIDRASHRCLLISKQADDLTEKNAELTQAYDNLYLDYTKKKEECDMLNDVIVKMRTSTESDKLLKERLPYGLTNTIRYMDYRKITDTESLQYKLQQDCDTDVTAGIRVFYKEGVDYFCAALGSAYGRDIGDTWHVTLECGTEFDIILSDFKDDGSTDYFGHPDTNYDEQSCTNVIEFVIDNDCLHPTVKNAGSFTALGYFGGLFGSGGNIVSMKYTGKAW